MNRINKLFEEKRNNLLSVFYTAGYPMLDDTVRIAQSLSAAGADIIEIGIPFSDPIADGPVIQESNRVALQNGMHVKLLIDHVRAIRAKVEAPILLMGYLNPVLQYGLERFCADAADAGVDGLILPDLPMREYVKDYKSVFEAHGLVNIFLVSPTTPDDRIREIDRVSNAFIYAVSSSSTTGVKNDFNEQQEIYFQRLNSMGLRNPFLVGFGVSSNKTFEKVCKYAAGAIVGSAFIKLIGTSSQLDTDIHSFVKLLKGN